jgi:hypothetical protein
MNAAFFCKSEAENIGAIDAGYAPQEQEAFAGLPFVPPRGVFAKVPQLSNRGASSRDNLLSTASALTHSRSSPMASGAKPRRR